MARTTRTDERQAALRFACVALGWVVCLLGWATILTFNVADWPADVVWPPSDHVHNVCGRAGAWVAYYAFTYLGVATYPLMLVLHAMVVAAGRTPLTDLFLRYVGVLLICGSSATLGALLLQPSNPGLLTGPGGVLGTIVAGWLLPNLEWFGTVLLLCLSLVVGFILAADNLVAGLFRGARWAGRTSGPVIIRGGSVVASAGAALASNVAASVSERLSPASPAPAPASARTERAVSSAPRPTKLAKAAPPQRPAPDDDDAEEWEDGPAGEYDASANDDVEPEAPVVEPPRKKAESPAKPAPAPAAPAPTKVLPVARPTPPRGNGQFTPPKAPADVRATDDQYALPPLNLLDRSTPTDKAAIETLCREKAYVLEQTLNEFRLAVEVVAIETGPVITVFELKLAPGIKVSQIASLSNDMARALKAPAVRVVAPLPGKSTIGIEVPNIDKEKVRLRDVMELGGPRVEQYALPLYLGKDVAGQPLVADLTRMPHLLIAGTTGSGKSVCVTSIIMSVLMTRKPSEVQMILVDPKVVELSMYKEVPHLMCPIVTEVTRAEAILDWASTKMDERYALLAEAGVKDIRSYNRLGYAGLCERLKPSCDEEMTKIPVRLPYIIIMIDELADLMMTSAKEVEFYLCRIAQKSRAVGIHLIVSTQRPQANVVTGLIKSNLPSRIAFRVSSRLDSRIVLDQNGGEVLMGQGDMLFLPPGSSKLDRAQGTFVDDDELRAVVKHCREQRAPDFHPELVRLPSAGEGGGGAERDELFDQAVDIILETGRGSVSLLQRRLTVGYGRASRLVDQMYAAGIVGEYKGSQAREVIMTREEWEAVRNQRNREEAAEAAGPE
jgi:DNA segregation ATPase FtsK/SpoIIIE, S-DNA-T family